MPPPELEGVRHVPFDAPKDDADQTHNEGSAAIAGDPELGTVILNETAFDNNGVMGALTNQHPEIASMIRWSNSTQRRPTGSGIFERDRFVTPSHVFDQMRVAQDAVSHDDICASVLESSEALAFNKMSIEAWDEDEEDIWNQIAADLNLDSRLREMWRELFTVSQFYAFTWWGSRSYKVSGRSESGIKRKKTFLNLRVPVGLSLLDPTRVVPVGNLLFNQDQLAYIATYQDAENIEPVINGTGTDPVISNMFTGRYTPTDGERRQLANLGIDTLFLYLLNPATVWRHTETRPQYKRFADVRMKSVFELLDLKNQLREMDRAHLIGGTNFIVLIRKGSKERPAQQTEIDNLQSNFRTMARVPVIFGDERLQIDIITPNNDKTLQPERYHALNNQIASRLFQMFATQVGSRADDSLKLARVIARGLESRRHMLMRSIEKNVLFPCYERNEQFTDLPSLRFHPKQIALDFDAGLAAFYMDLRDRREISRDTLLAQIDLSEAEEARKREREAEHFDDTFGTLTALQDPEKQQALQLEAQKQQQDFQERMSDKNFQRQQKLATQNQNTNADTSGSTTGGGGTSSRKRTPASSDPKAAGRNLGGNRKGGGAAPGTGQGQEPDPRRRAKK